MRLQCQTTTIFALVVFAAVPVFAQDKQSGEKSGGVKKSTFVIDKNFLQGLDKNDDGMIDPSEISDRTRSFLKEAGADISKPISIKSFTKKLKEGDKLKRDAKDGNSAQKSLGFAVASNERDDPAGGSLGFAVIDAENTKVDQTREFSSRAKSMLDWVMRKYDRDGDGRIDPEEVKSGRWADPPVSESDTNKDGSLSRMELLVRYQNREDEKSGSSKDGRSRGRGSRDLERDGGRGERTRFGGSSSSSRDESSRSGGRDVRKGYESYVEGVFKSYDKNSDAFLDEEELAKMRRKPDKSADANEDSKISKKELLDSYLAKAEGKSGSSKSDSRKGKSTNRKVSRKANVASKSGVSGSQLTSKDKNGNGQIEMAEYESNWTAEKIEEFYVKDKNRDGVITKIEWETK